MSDISVKYATLVEADEPRKGVSVERLALFNEDGSPFDPAGITTSQAVAAVAAKTQIQAVVPVALANVSNASAAPTQTEFNAVVALLNQTKTRVNDLIAAIKA